MEPNTQEKDLLAALKAAKASWQEDGLGLRGQPESVYHSEAQLIWESVPAFRRPNLAQG